MSKQLAPADLYSLEDYARERAAFRARVMRHKRDRRLFLGEHVVLHFEDRLTIQYQVQEILLVERIFEAAAIQEELEVYNPLIPDGDNWKATLMVEYPDPAERRRRLAQLIGLEERVWLRVGEHEKLRPIADEDLERQTQDKTSAVHFLRFQPSPAMVSDLKRPDVLLAAGVDHPHYTQALSPIPEKVRAALLGDLREDLR